jgi:hypothetical protein
MSSNSSWVMFPISKSAFALTKVSDPINSQKHICVGCGCCTCSITRAGGRSVTLTRDIPRKVGSVAFTVPKERSVDASRPFPCCVRYESGRLADGDRCVCLRAIWDDGANGCKGVERTSIHVRNQAICHSIKSIACYNCSIPSASSSHPYGCLLIRFITSCE